MYSTSFVEKLDLQFYDALTYIVGKIDTESSSSIVIVDIDEKSLSYMGQWPWPRIVLAQLITKISDAKPSAIGLDILLPEKDRTSPIEIKSFYKNFFNIDIDIKGLDKKLYNNDLILAEAIKNSNSVLGYYLSDAKITNNSCDNIFNIPNTFELKNLNNYDFIMCDSPIIQNSSLVQGYVNKYIDTDGVFRHMPLAQGYKGLVLPSFGLSILLSIDDKIKYSKNQLEILTTKVKVSNDSRILLNYYSASWYKKVSAIDLLRNKIDKKMLNGKIVLIGSSSIALHDRVVIPNGREMAGVQVNATIIGNLLDNRSIIELHKYKILNFIISFLLSILLIIILLKKSRIWIVILFFSVFSLSLIFAFVKFYNGVYISLGYLLVPYFLHFFIINILVIIIDVIEKKKFAEDLNKSQMALFDSMVHVAEAHDIETGEHIVRTKLYVKLLAQAIYEKGLYKDYLSLEKIDMMYQTSALHDIGKVGISDLILKKPAKLTDEEFVIMKTHSKLGKNIIDNAISSYKENEFFVTARNITYCHHERYDGTGYPKGLKGEEIPLEARIMALADVYDALMSKRVYKKSFSYEKTKQIIISGTNEHFDPVVVEAYLNKEEEFKKISIKYKEV